MPNLLLDHPWPVTAALDAKSEAFEVLEAFDALVKSHHTVSPVAFFEREQYSTLCEELDREGRTFGSHLVRLVWPYVRWQESENNSTASPIPQPDGPALPRVWRKALREALGDLTDWRNPQIVVAQRRRNHWPDGLEIRIAIDGTDSGESRVLAALENYDTHPFAVSDFDPWDIERCHPTAANGRLSHYPCRLPKHPELENLPLADVSARLENLRRTSWRYELNGRERYCYIPPAGWDPLLVVKPDWRECRAFPHGRAGGGQGSGPLDHWNRIWVWDRRGERHWDVQYPVRNPEDNPERCVISHTGDLLRGVPR